MNVLSLFDGISCGRVALERAGIKVDKYYASEIDKRAIQVSRNNWPEIIQLGSITEWHKWGLPRIDIVIGGSPCQGFSIAGGRANFDDPRSKLFFEFYAILKHYKPEVFLLENVLMDSKSCDVISSMLGELYPNCVEQKQLFKTGRLEPIMLNSALVSAQNRERLYWTNIPNIQQPKDKGIMLKDILEQDIHTYNGVMVNGAAIRNQVTRSGIEEQLNIRKDGKSNCVVSTFSNRLNCVSWCHQIALIGPGGQGNRIYSIDGKIPTLGSQTGGKAGPGSCLIGCKQIGEADLKGNDSIRRVYSPDAKSPTLTTMGGGHREPKISQDNITWRKLTPIECERLQTLPDNYTAGVSNSARYHALGNGWTVDVIAHIFKHISLHTPN